MKKFILGCMCFVVAMLVVSSTEAAITNLAWDANTESDLAGYKLYQSSTGPTGPWVLIRTVLKPALTAATADLPDGTYHWTLTAYDTLGQESGYSNIVSRTINTTIPTITTILPVRGPTAGGTPVTITGTNLTGTSSVTFGGTAATSVTVVSATSVTCVTPAKAAGAVNVVLTTPGGSVTSTNGYTYTAAPLNPKNLRVAP